MADQTPKPKPHGYGRAPRRRPSRYVMTTLRPDAYQAVVDVMTAHNLSASGAVHHLVRLGAGLDPLI
jgi:hypothetical protein